MPSRRQVSGGLSSKGEIQHGLIKGNMMSFLHRLRLKIRKNIPHGVGKTEEETGKLSGTRSAQAGVVQMASEMVW